MKLTKVSDFIFEFLKNNNANDVFLVPGGGNMHLTDSVKKNKKLKYINFFHEQSAVIAAEAYSRTKSKLGVALVTSGPGVTNAITGAVGAWIESVPLFIISGQVKTADLKGKKKIRQYGPQEVETSKIVKSFTKYSKTIINPNEVIPEIKKALTVCLDQRKGPVWLDIPLDVQGAYINVKKNDTKKIKHKFYDYKFNKFNIFREIQKAKKPIILAGNGVKLANANKDFKIFLKKLKIPVLTTWNVNDLLYYNHEFYFGSPGVVARRYSNIILQKSDLIICIGTSLNQIVVSFNPKEFGKNAKKIIIDIDNEQLKNIHIPKSFKIKSCAKFFLEKMNTYLKKRKVRNFKNWISDCRNIKNKYSNESFEMNKKGKIISHYLFTDTLSNLLKENDCISTGSSGLAIEIFYTYFKIKKNQKMFLTAGLGSMGYGLPAAIGNCIANNRKKIFLVESDGSMMFNLQELATIKSYKLPIKIIIMNNLGYASIRNTHRNYFNSRYVGTGKEDSIFYPNFKILAKSFDIEYHSIKSKKYLSHDLSKSLKSKSSAIIEIILKKNETLLPKVSSIILDNGKIQSMPMEDMSPLVPLKDLKKMFNGNINKKSIQIRKQKINF